MTPDQIVSMLFGREILPYAHSRVIRGYQPYRKRDCVIAYGLWPTGALMILKRDRSYFSLFVNRFSADNAFSYNMQDLDVKVIAPILEEKGNIVDKAVFDRMKMRLIAEAL